MSFRASHGNHASDAIFYATQIIDFPPCLSLATVEFAEQIIYALCGLTEFIRPVTAAERAAGIGSEYGAVFISKADSRVTRLYGNSILLN